SALFHFIVHLYHIRYRCEVMTVFANGGNNPCRSVSLRGWVCQRKALRSLDRRASCPIVTFQTERKGIWDSLLPPMAVEIDVRGARRRLFACKVHSASNMVNLKLRHCALGSAVRPGTDSGSRERQLSTARVQTAAFLQQVPTTIELGPYRAGTVEVVCLPN